MNWRIVKQRRRIGFAYWVQQGTYAWNVSGRRYWRTEYEENFASIDEARARLKSLKNAERQS